MKKILIITGGRVSGSFVKSVVSDYKPDAVIAADRGIEAAREALLIPDYIVGDFDSAGLDVLEYFKTCFAEYGKPVIRTFNSEKDETDTELALSTALTLEPDKVVLLGATGTRLDHTMANISLLSKLLSNGVKGVILDEYNMISLYDEGFTLKRKGAFGRYFSLLPFTETVSGLTIKGAKYEIEDYFLAQGSSIGISNEIEKSGVKMSFTEGILMCIQSSDVPFHGVLKI